MFGKEKETKTVSFPVEGMMCGRCAARVENALKEVKGVVNAHADVEAKSVSVECLTTVPEDKLTAAVVAAGYKA